ncbi:unannotated protein [freshwater metagenome]|uniref:Unannotated protein n=1 Tax=freshwater metagenome TaxID=449393 RepID=A0A6J6NWE5_9ZZZZ
MRSNIDLETKRELIEWLDAKRRHILQQVEAMDPVDRRRSLLPSGWTPLGLVRHLTLDVERFWFRAVMGGERVDLPKGYEGWTTPPDQSDAEVFEQYTRECQRVSVVLEPMSLDSAPVWWPDGDGAPPYGSLREVILHVLVETATHAGQLDICRELVDGGQRLVLDEPG